MSTALGVTGLLLTLIGAGVLAYLDLTAQAPTWNTLASEWRRRRKYAWFGFPLIVVGTIFGIAALLA